MTPEGPGRREFAQFVTHHLFIDQDGYVLTTIVYSDRQAHHFRQYHRTPGPGFYRPLAVRADGNFHLGLQVVVYKWTFLDRTWHSFYLPLRRRMMYLSELLLLRVL